jgi:hypothetical protein
MIYTLYLKTNKETTKFGTWDDYCQASDAALDLIKHHHLNPKTELWLKADTLTA